MQTKKVLPAVNLILDSHRGIYIPRDFVTDHSGNTLDEGNSNWGLTEANIAHWGSAADPESEGYWDAWSWILDNAEYTDDSGNKYRLHQDGDLWGVCYDRMTDDEKSNFGFED